MTGFQKYQHVEKLGTSETDGILEGTCHVFYKIDGTNASVWWQDGDIRCGSRNRELSLDNDNAGFMAWATGDGRPRLEAFFAANPNCRLYGEWLVPHSLKTYRDDAWRDFYVFDVVQWDQEAETAAYLPYDVYQPLLEEAGINYIPPLAVIKNPTEDNLLRFMDKSGQFLVKDGAGKGEGLVIKNYRWRNRYGRQTWAKMITNEFKEKHHKEMGAPLVNGTLLVEEKIVDEFLTEAFVQKEKAKIELEAGGWFSNCIPRLLGTVYYEFVREETWNYVKKHKNPKINFQVLNTLCIRKTKEYIGL